jgi:hypothetical protein
MKAIEEVSPILVEVPASGKPTFVSLLIDTISWQIILAVGFLD